MTGRSAGLAPAKINLYLHVVGRRPDGYHLLDSLVGFAGIGDRLAVAPDAGLSLQVLGPFAAAAGPAEHNLVLRAAQGLSQLLGGGLGARIELEKRLPVAAGLGGGSADAAAALRLLTALWRAAPDAASLGRLALSLGADVPVCLAGRAAQVAGIGETVVPIALPRAHLVLANPGVPLATPKVFAALAGRFSPAAPIRDPPADARALAAALAERHNDLEAPAIEIAPAVAQVLTALAGLPGALLARMSGSGSTCFALFDDAPTAAAAARRLAGEAPEWWVADGPLLSEATG